MSDRYAQLVNSPVGSLVARRVGLPLPPTLERHRDGDPVIRGRVLVGAAPDGRLAGAIAETLAGAGAQAASTLVEPLRAALADAGLDATIFNPDAPGEQRFKGLIFDATGIGDSTDLALMHAFFHPAVSRLERCARLIVLATPPAECPTPRAATAQRAIEGFTRSLGKEVGGRGATVQLVYVSERGAGAIASTLRFLLSPRSAYVDGQVIHIGAGKPPARIDWEQPLAGKVALVTGASRGIGAAIAAKLAEQGAKIVGLDVPALGAELGRLMSRLDGDALELDITTPEAPEAIAAHFADGLDIAVHNAGVTLDRTLAKMPAERWSKLMEINLSSIERIDDALLAADVIAKNGRIICVSSMSGIAGNAGQTNYATSKAGVIGMVEALAAPLAKRGITINAVAPGFIETQMTARMPIAIREAGRRMSSLSQGGLPVDVAEAIAWFAHPASSAVNGNVVRVCGQNLLGA
jgi:3-oxoacyl-[acyl-carrier protein] reductase